MNHVRERRLALGLTQRQAAGMCRDIDAAMDASTLSRIENGMCLPTAKGLEALEIVFKTSAADLFPPEDLRIVRHLEDVSERQDVSECATVLEQLIPLGRDRAVKREDLARMLEVTDRRVRLMIEQARGAGLLICNDGDGRGYYRTDAVEDLVKQYRQDTHRALSILYRRKAVRKALIAAGVDVGRL